jgi:hypothetical protein
VRHYQRWRVGEGKRDEKNSGRGRGGTDCVHGGLALGEGTTEDEDAR